jgi:hypothetical protein
MTIHNPSTAKKRLTGFFALVKIDPGAQSGSQYIATVKLVKFAGLFRKVGSPQPR